MSSTSFVINDLLASYDSINHLKIEPDGLIDLVYEQNLETFRSEQKINLDSIIDIPVNIPNLGLTYPPSGVFSQSFSIVMPLNKQHTFDSLIIKKLIFHLTGS